MKPIITEIIIPLAGSHHAIFAEHRVVLKIEDEAAGPYLAIEGIDESDGTTTPHCFCLESAATIDEFAAICKKMLADAEESYK